MKTLGLSPSTPKLESRWKNLIWPTIRNEVDVDTVRRQGMLPTHQCPGILGIIFLALLLSNVRGTWLSAQWRSEAKEPPPIPLGETFTAKLTDRLPIHVWPVGRWIFYVLAVLQTGAILLAFVAATRSLSSGGLE